jgi:polyisoprenoid-binding protein YceI
MRWISICFITFVSFTSVVRAQDSAGIPVYKITPVESRIKFGVKASVPIEGTFDKWNATLAFTSNNVSAGLLIIEIQAEFFDVKENPLITFKSTKIEQTGPNDFSVDGDFTIRGVTKHERLTLTASGKGTESGAIAGIMAFDRKEYGMNSGIPFIKIADRVEVGVNLRWQRVSGPPLALPK